MNQRLLVIDDQLPNPQHGYGYPRSNLVLEGLIHLGCQVDFWPFQGCDAANWPKSPLLLKMRILPSGMEALRAYLIQESSELDCIWISRPRNYRTTVALIKSVAPHLTIIYDTEALSSLREKAKVELNAANCLAIDTQSLLAQEINMIATADIALAVTRDEADLLRQSGLGEVVILGHAHEVSSESMDFGVRQGILFVGGFYRAASPNLDAIVHFVRDIWPLISTTLKCSLTVVGHRAPVVYRYLRRLRLDVTGVDFVEAPLLSTYYSRTRVAVVPTRYAAGLAWKVTEALSFGIPVVTTPLIASQLNAVISPVVTASTASAFANAVCCLYSSEHLWQAQRELAFEYARCFCNIEQLRTSLTTILHLVAHKRGVKTTTTQLRIANA